MVLTATTSGCGLGLNSLKSGDGCAGSLCASRHESSRLVAANTSAPVSSVLFELVKVVGFGGRNKLRQLGLVFRADVLQSEDGSLLLVDDCPEAGLVLDDDVRNAHLAAQGRDEENELDGVDIVGNDNEVRLLGLYTRVSMQIMRKDRRYTLRSKQRSDSNPS